MGRQGRPGRIADATVAVQLVAARSSSASSAQPDPSGPRVGSIPSVSPTCLPITTCWPHCTRATVQPVRKISAALARRQRRLEQHVVANTNQRFSSFGCRARSGRCSARVHHAVVCRISRTSSSHSAGVRCDARCTRCHHCPFRADCRYLRPRDTSGPQHPWNRVGERRPVRKGAPRRAPTDGCNVDVVGAARGRPAEHGVLAPVPVHRCASVGCGRRTAYEAGRTASAYSVCRRWSRRRRSAHCARRRRARGQRDALVIDVQTAGARAASCAPVYSRRRGLHTADIRRAAEVDFVQTVRSVGPPSASRRPRAGEQTG